MPANGLGLSGIAGKTENTLSDRPGLANFLKKSG
jgi:hypothetical protein